MLSVQPRARQMRLPPWGRRQHTDVRRSTSKHRAPERSRESQAGRGRGVGLFEVEAGRSLRGDLQKGAGSGCVMSQASTSAGGEVCALRDGGQGGWSGSECGAGSERQGAGRGGQGHPRAWPLPPRDAAALEGDRGKAGRPGFLVGRGRGGGRRVQRLQSGWWRADPLSLVAPS